MQCINCMMTMEEYEEWQKQRERQYLMFPDDGVIINKIIKEILSDTLIYEQGLEETYHKFGYALIFALMKDGLLLRKEHE